jgi:hypothetical protein
MSAEPKTLENTAGSRLRIPRSTETDGYRKVGAQFTAPATKSDLRADRYVNKWALFDASDISIGKVINRRDKIQTVEDPSGMMQRLGLVNGNYIDVIVDQEYYLLTDVNKQLGVWLPSSRFDIGGAILKYARMLYPWTEHLAVRAKVPNV